jgi:hypothetical protein
LAHVAELAQKLQNAPSPKAPTALSAVQQIRKLFADLELPIAAVKDYVNFSFCEAAMKI